MKQGKKQTKVQKRTTIPKLIEVTKEVDENGFGTLLAPGLVGIDRVLVQFACSVCGEVTYKPILAITHDEIRNNYEKTVSDIEAQIFNEQFPRRHSSGVFENDKMKEQNLPSGFAFCGYWRVVGLWKLLERHDED